LVGALQLINNNFVFFKKIFYILKNIFKRDLYLAVMPDPSLLSLAAIFRPKSFRSGGQVKPKSLGSGGRPDSIPLGLAAMPDSSFWDLAHLIIIFIILIIILNLSDQSSYNF
jgi:hypothetical protein